MFTFMKKSMSGRLRIRANLINLREHKTDDVESIWFCRCLSRKHWIKFQPESNPLSVWESHHEERRQGGDVDDCLKRKNVTATKMLIGMPLQWKYCKQNKNKNWVLLHQGVTDKDNQCIDHIHFICVKIFVTSAILQTLVLLGCWRQGKRAPGCSRSVKKWQTQNIFKTK